MADPRGVTEEKQMAISGLFDDLPKEYQATQFQLQALHHAFMTKLAKTFEPKLNTYLKSKECSNLRYHQELAGYIDTITSKLGLCLSFNGEPALLVAERSRSGNADAHQYAILVPGKGRIFERKSIASTLPTLKLIPAPDGVDAMLGPLRLHAYPGARTR